MYTMEELTTSYIGQIDAVMEALATLPEGADRDPNYTVSFDPYSDLMDHILASFHDPDDEVSEPLLGKLHELSGFMDDRFPARKGGIDRVIAAVANT